jgi:membrane protease YdiL (CAAX protease family)
MVHSRAKIFRWTARSGVDNRRAGVDGGRWTVLALMIQRLLRGQWLYFIFATLIVLLYMRAMRTLSSQMLDDPSMAATHLSATLESPGTSPGPVSASAQEGQNLEWWPSQIRMEDVQRLLQEQPFLAIMLAVLMCFMGGVGLAGVVMTFSALRTGRIRSVWRYPSRRLPRWSFGELGRIFILAIMVFSLLPLIRFSLPARWVGLQPHSHLWIPVSMLVLNVWIILTILVFAEGKGSSVWQTLGFSVRKFWPSVATGFRGYVAVFPWMFALLFLAVEVTRWLGLKPPIEPIQELLFVEQDPRVLALTIVLACVAGPVGEEFFFRGVLYPAIRHRTSRMTAMLASGATFSLIHTNPVGFLSIMLMGCLLANLYERTGSLISPLVVHLLHNTFLMSMALVFRRLLMMG